MQTYQALSMAVTTVWRFTEKGSQIPRVSMSVIAPVVLGIGDRKEEETGKVSERAFKTSRT